VSRYRKTPRRQRRHVYQLVVLAGHTIAARCAMAPAIITPSPLLEGVR
jgi:hypothetical protein